MKKIEEEILLKAFEINRHERRDLAHWRVGIKAFLSQLPAARSQDRIICGINESTWLSFKSETSAHNAALSAYSQLTQYLKSHHFENIEYGVTNLIQAEIFLALGYAYVVSKKLYIEGDAISLREEWEKSGLTCFIVAELSEGADLYESEGLKFTKFKNLVRTEHLAVRGHHARIPGSVESCLMNENEDVRAEARETIDKAFAALEKSGLAVKIRGKNPFFSWQGISILRAGIQKVAEIKEKERMDSMAEQESKRGRTFGITCSSCGEVYFQTSTSFDPNKRLTGAMLELLPNLDAAMWSMFSSADIGDSLICPNCESVLVDYNGFLRPESLIELDVFDTETSAGDPGGGSKKEIKNEVLKLLDEGLFQIDVANTLGIDKGYVSKVRKRAINDGLLTTNNKLTQPGFVAVSG